MPNQINISAVGQKPGPAQPNVSGPATSSNFSAPQMGGTGFMPPAQGAVAVPTPPPNRPLSTPEQVMMQALMRRIG